MGYHQSALSKAYSRSKAVGTACVLVLAASLAQAGDTNESAQWGIGLGAVLGDSPYVDVDSDTSAIPALYFENRYIRFFATTLAVKLPGLSFGDSNELNFSLIGRWDGSGYEAEDSWALDGMDERKGGVWGGAKVEWNTPLLDISADWTQDLSGNSDGQRVKLTLDRSWQLGERLTFKPRISAIWNDSKYIDYYYGVRAHEARDWRSEYPGEAGVRTEVGLRATYRLTRKDMFVFDARARSLSSQAKDSPLVDGSADSRFIFGYMRFF